MNTTHAGRTSLIAVLFAAHAMAQEPGSAAARQPIHPLITVPERTDRQKTAQQLHDQALKAFNAGNLVAAKLGFQKVLVMSPGNAAALINLALVEQRGRHFDDAERYIRQLLRDDPRNGTAWLILGMGAYEQNQLEGAMAHLAQAVLYAPADARAHHYLGVTLGRRGWYSAGEEELRRAVELDPKFADAHYNLAALYLEREPPAIELARRHYQKALELGATPDERLAKRIGD
jgi:Flp pilus assembly protein TadD